MNLNFMAERLTTTTRRHDDRTAALSVTEGVGKASFVAAACYVGYSVIKSLAEGRLPNLAGAALPAAMGTACLHLNRLVQNTPIDTIFGGES